MYGSSYRKAANEEIDNLEQQNDKLRERLTIANAYAEALRTGQDNAAYSIFLNPGQALTDWGITDTDYNAIIDDFNGIINNLHADVERA